MRSICLSVVMVGACAGADLELAEVDQEASKCQVEVCGTNSPEIDNMGFHDLDMTRNLANDTGFRLVGFEQKGQDYDLVVRGAQLFGVSANDSISGQDLVGAFIIIEHSNRDQYAIRIKEVGTLPIPIPPLDPSQPTTVETYELDYSRMSYGQPSREWKNICGAIPFDDLGNHEYGRMETFGQDPKHSILFEGDRIHLDSMRIENNWAPDWFNIGCSGHTLAKLFLTRNASVSQGHNGLFEERQTSLRVLTGDYCGTGRPFTVAGQKLVWTGGQMPFMATPDAIEAQWNENGAICLDTPRMAQPTTETGMKMYPRVQELEDAIEAQCGKRPRPCDQPGERDTTSFVLPAGSLRASGNW